MPPAAATFPCLTYISVCSGIEAATVAWHPLGWQPLAFAEIDRFPSLVLAHHYPEVPNYGDFTQITQDCLSSCPDILVGGTPCQDFSVAGLRAGLAGARGQLTIEFVRLAERLRTRWLVWENVPGVLSADGGRAFGTFLRALAGIGYGVAYRVLDAQHFGVPQRRRRVFLVGYLGDWRRAAAVLFERQSLSGDSAPCREKREAITYDVAPCIGASGRGFERTGDTRGQDCLVPSVAFGGNNTSGPIDIGTAVCVHGGPCGRMDFESETFIASGRGYWNKAKESQPLGTQARALYESTLVAHSLRGVESVASEDGTGRGTPLVPVGYRVHGENSTAMTSNGIAHVADPVDTARSLDSCGGYATNQGGNVVLQPIDLRQTSRGEKITNKRMHGAGGPPGHGIGNDGDPAFTVSERGQAVAFSCKDSGADCGELSPTLRSMNFDQSHANAGGQVAIAFNLRGREGGSLPEPADMVSLRLPSGGSSRSYVATSLAPSAIGWSEELTAHVDLAGTVQYGGQGGRHEGVMTPTMAVRRLTPRECERLQGFPDDYTLIPVGTVSSKKLDMDFIKYQLRGNPKHLTREDIGKLAADGPRYKALGNSMAVPCMHWIGRRIQLVDFLKPADKPADNLR